MDATLDHHTWLVIVSEASLVELQGAEAEGIVERADVLPESARVKVILEQEAEEVRGWLLEGGQGDLPAHTTHSRSSLLLKVAGPTFFAHLDESVA